MRPTQVFVCALFWAAVGAANCMAQQDKLTYVLTHAVVNVDQPRLSANQPGGCNRNNTDLVNNPCHSIEVTFGKSFPKENSLSYPTAWLVIVIDAKGNMTSHNPASVTVDKLNKEVILDLGEKTRGQYFNLNAGGNIDKDTHQIIIRYQDHNLPSVVLAQPEKKGTQKNFTAARGKSDADIYFSGSATAERGSGPLYAIDAKAGYLQSLGRGGALGGKATFVSNSKSDVDPDSITASGSYQKVFVFPSVSSGLILNSDFLGFEFDKKDKTRNLMSELDGTLVIPSAQIGENTFATADFMLGFEAGHNYKNEMNPKGLGNIWRPKFGVNAYLLALHPRVFNRITLNGQYLIRLPRTAEPFTEKINGSKVTSLSKRPRHYVGADLGLLFAPAYGLTLKYRYGSLPPDFKLVNSEVSAGFVLQLKQANK